MDYNKKKQKKVKQEGAETDEEGDAWIYNCVKRGSYLFIAYSVGKWTQETCREMIEKLYHRVELPFPDNKLEVFSDGNDDYEYVLPEYYAETCINYGQLIKVRKGGKVIDKIKRVVFGNPCVDDIETTNIENLNSIMRERLGRLVRKTKCHTKKKLFLIHAIELLQFHWNTMKPIHGRASPAMKELLTDHIWSWDDFLMYQYAL